MHWGKVAIKLIFFSKLIFKNLLFKKMTTDYCLLLVFGNSGENNLLLLEADVCVRACVCENLRNSRSKTNNHHCAYTKKTVCKEDSNQNKE